MKKRVWLLSLFLSLLAGFCIWPACAREMGQHDSAADKAADVARWQQQCTAKDGAACTQLGLHYFAANPAQAFPFMQKACQLNDAWGCYQAGEQYLHGVGAPQNSGQARQSMRQACLLRQGLSSAIACNDVGYLYEQTGNTKDALVLYNMACDMNDQRGCMNLVKYHTKQYQQHRDAKSEAAVQHYFDRACAVQGQAQICALAAEIKKPDGMSFILQQKFSK